MGVKLIVGLGNPGKKYEGTRHNMGFITVDRLADMLAIDLDKEAFQGVSGRGKYLDKDVILFKPSTYMNLSGVAVKEVVNFFKIDIEDIIIVYDDMSLQPGVIKFKTGGSNGGHNGIKNIIENLATEKIKRVKIGIGEPPYTGIDFVLSKPLKDEWELIDPAISRACDGIKEALKSTFDKAMSLYNC